MKEQALWVERYRPKTIEEYVFIDEHQQAQVQTWVNEKHIPNLLLTGVQGTGKTTLAKVLLNELGAHEFDIKIINASRDNGVEYIRDTVENFCSTMPYGEYKYIILDEADGLSHAAQATLRGVIEKYSDSVRFILTANYRNKIIPALHSRCQGFHIEKLDRNEFTARLARILIDEEIQFDLDTLDTFVASSYPDLRKAIQSCQQYSLNGELKKPEHKSVNEGDYRLQMVQLFKSGKYTEARKLICSQIGPEEYEDLFKFMYQNLYLWASTPDKEIEAIIIIRNGLVKHTSCADPEINLSATLCELEILASS